MALRRRTLNLSERPQLPNNNNPLKKLKKSRCPNFAPFQKEPYESCKPGYIEYNEYCCEEDIVSGQKYPKNPFDFNSPDWQKRIDNILPTDLEYSNYLKSLEAIRNNKEKREKELEMTRILQIRREQLRKDMLDYQNYLVEETERQRLEAEKDRLYELEEETKKEKIRIDLEAERQRQRQRQINEETTERQRQFRAETAAIQREVNRTAVIEDSYGRRNSQQLFPSTQSQMADNAADLASGTFPTHLTPSQIPTQVLDPNGNPLPGPNGTPPQINGGSLKKKILSKKINKNNKKNTKKYNKKLSKNSKKNKKM